MSDERKCPLCGSAHSHFHDSYSDGDEWVERDFRLQGCMNLSCSLPCRLWDRVEALVAKAAEAERLPKREVADVEDLAEELTAPCDWCKPCIACQLVAGKAANEIKRLRAIAAADDAFFDAFNHAILLFPRNSGKSGLAKAWNERRKARTINEP